MMKARQGMLLDETGITFMRRVLGIVVNMPSFDRVRDYEICANRNYHGDSREGVGIPLRQVQKVKQTTPYCTALTPPATRALDSMIGISFGFSEGRVTAETIKGVQKRKFRASTAHLMTRNKIDTDFTVTTVILDRLNLDHDLQS
jgi:hypothetical protein